MCAENVGMGTKFLTTAAAVLFCSSCVATVSRVDIRHNDNVAFQNSCCYGSCLRIVSRPSVAMTCGAQRKVDLASTRRSTMAHNYESSEPVLTRRSLLKEIRSCRRAALRGLVGPEEVLRILFEGRRHSTLPADLHKQLLEIFALAVRKRLAGLQDFETLLEEMNKSGVQPSQPILNAILEVCSSRSDLASRGYDSNDPSCSFRNFDSQTSHVSEFWWGCRCV